MRGLKSLKFELSASSLLVAPYTGAWIEIYIDLTSNLLGRVAPYTGAWIEILF